VETKSLSPVKRPKSSVHKVAKKKGTSQAGNNRATKVSSNYGMGIRKFNENEEEPSP